MKCHHCENPIEYGVKLSEYATVCETCYAEMVTAWREEHARVSLKSFCPPPDQLHERIAAVRRGNGMEPRPVATGGTYRPRVTTTNITGRRGTEGRTV